MKKIAALLLVVILGFTAKNFAANLTQEPSSAILTNWMNLHCKIVKKAKDIAHVAYSRHFSYTAIAAYESIVGTDPNYRSLSGQLNGLSALPVSPKNLVANASLNAAYADMLRYFYGPFASCNPLIDSMEKAQSHALSKANINLKLIAQSTAYGKAVAAAIIQWAQTDKSNNNREYTPFNGEGIWVPSGQAAAPFWSDNRNLTKNVLTAFVLQPPMYSADSATEFYKMAREVYTVTSNLSTEQKATALYWDDSPDGNYMTVFGHWTSILCGILKESQLSLLKGSEAYTKMAIAMHEAAILAWKGKYQYNVVRPVTYIQKHIDRQWRPLIATPPHPEFPAAHPALSNAAAVALSFVFGDSCIVKDNSYLDINMNERTYPSIGAVAKEAGISRLYGGIHYWYSIEQGFVLGAATANFVNHAIRFRAN